MQNAAKSMVLFFKVSPSKMMEFQELLLVLEGFGRTPGGNQKKIIKKIKILYKIYGGFGKVPASKRCKMQQNQWFSLVFQGFTKQNDGIPGVFASFGRFWQETRWKS